MNDLQQLTYTIAEAGKLTNEHKATWYRRAYRGEVQVLAGGGRLRIPRSEIEKFLSKTVIYQPKAKRK